MEPLEEDDAYGVTAQFSVGRQDGFAPAPSPPPVASSTANKKVLLRRSLQAVPSTSEILDHEEEPGSGSPSGAKKVLLAHRIKPGQTIQLKGQKATATMRDDGPADLSSESMVGMPLQGPRYDKEGMLLSFSVLGPAEEFEAQQQRAALSARPAPEPPPQAPTFGTTAPHPRLDALEAAEDTARLKNELAAQRQMMAETRGEQFRRSWDKQMRSLSRETGVPADKLMMARTGEYRKVVQQREVLEALRRRQHPYGGNRAWQIGLRESGVFYEAIGNASNGIFCPFKQPDDAAALARAGALAHQPHAELSLAALEAKIVDERRAAMAASEALGPDESEAPTGAMDAAAAAAEADAAAAAAIAADDDDYIDPESFDVVNEAHLAEIARLRDKYNIEGAAPAHLSGDERTLWGIFKEIDTDESVSRRPRPFDPSTLATLGMTPWPPAAPLACLGRSPTGLRIGPCARRARCPSRSSTPPLPRWAWSRRLRRCCASSARATSTATGASIATSSSRWARRWMSSRVRRRPSPRSTATRAAPSAGGHASPFARATGVGRG